jgi:hypothetical protein
MFTPYAKTRFLRAVRRRRGHCPEQSPPDDRPYDEARAWMLSKTRCGRYLGTCFDGDGLTPTGNRMKRFLNRQGFALGPGFWPVLEFLMQRDDSELKGLFGRKFLAIGRRAHTAYNRFVQVHGMANAHLWAAMDEGEKAQYRAEDVRPKIAPPSRPNAWTQALAEWHRRENRPFKPIRKGSREYGEVRAIQETLTEQRPSLGRAEK